MLSKKLPLILRVSIFVINMLIDLDEATERGSELQAVLTLLLTKLMVLMYS